MKVLNLFKVAIIAILFGIANEQTLTQLQLLAIVMGTFVIFKVVQGEIHE